MNWASLTLASMFDADQGNASTMKVVSMKAITISMSPSLELVPLSSPSFAHALAVLESRVWG
jgi:hypothetical protein